MENDKKEILKNEELSKEEIAKILSKEISVRQLTPEVKSKISQILKDYALLAKELAETKNNFLGYKGKLDSKIEDLVSKKFLSSDKLDIAQYEQSLKKYEGLLQDVISEVERDSKFFQEISEGKLPENLTVLKWASDDSNDYFEEKIKNSKKYIKDTSKNLRITYSRHKLSFDNQLRELDYYQMYLQKNMKKAE